MEDVKTAGMKYRDACEAQKKRFEEIKTLPDDQKVGKAEEIKRADAELATLNDAYTAARVMDEAEKRVNDELAELKTIDRRVPFGTPGAAEAEDAEAYGVNPPKGFKSLGDSFVRSDAFKAMHRDSKPAFAVDVEGVTLKHADGMKAVMSTSAGISAYPPQQADVVPIARRRPVVADLMPSTDTQAPAIIYLEQTTATNAAASVAEGASKPQSTLVWTRRTVPLEVIAHYIPITNQELEDIPGIRDIVDQELIAMLKLAEETAILNGDGISPNLVGILNKTGVQTQAKGADDLFTAAMKAFTLIRHTGFADVSGGVMHPNDWLAYVTAQDTTGRFIYGNPADAVVQRVWGVPVVVTTAMTENTALFGDFAMYARLWRKGGIRVEVGLVNDDFIKNQQSIRCEERAALQIRRPAAFATLTGI